MSIPVTGKPRFARMRDTAPWAQQYFLAALRTREVREQDGVYVHAQSLARRGLDHLQRSAEQAVAVFHYVQSSSRTPTTCESPGSCSVTP